MTLTREIFGEDTEKLIEAYFKSLKGSSIPGDYPHWAINNHIVNSIEASAQLAEMVAAHRLEHFVEVGCGLGIPSLTLGKLGYNGEAFDKNPRIIELGKQLAASLGLPNTRYTNRDFNYWFPTAPKGTFLIAETPNDLENSNFERDILELAIEKEYNIAIVPTIEGVPVRHPAAHAMARMGVEQKCAEFMERLIHEGYSTAMVPIEHMFAYNVVIGVK